MTIDPEVALREARRLAHVAQRALIRNGETEEYATGIEEELAAAINRLARAAFKAGEQWVRDGYETSDPLWLPPAEKEGE